MILVFIIQDLRTDNICRVWTAHLTTTDSVKIVSLRKSYNIRKVTDQQRVIALFVLVFKRRSHSTHLNQLTVEFRDFEFRDFSCYLRLSREQVAKAPKAKVPKIVVGSGTGSLGCISRANFASIAVPN
jgi:hypothetical protein